MIDRYRGLADLKVGLYVHQMAGALNGGVFS
jgi:hypothetical protein